MGGKAVDNKDVGVVAVGNSVAGQGPTRKIARLEPAVLDELSRLDNGENADVRSSRCNWSSDGPGQPRRA